MKLNVQTLLTSFTKFRRTFYFRIVYLVVLGVIVAELFPIGFGATACLGLLLMPAAVFVVPYYFGERRTKHFALNALPVFLISLLLVTAFQTQASMDPSPFELTSRDLTTASNATLPPLSLWNGTVAPFRATPPQDFTFRVRLRTNAVNVTNVTVYLNLTTVQSGSGNFYNFTMVLNQTASDGTWFTITRTLGPGIYEFGFSARDTAGNNTTTLTLLGPITGGFLDYYSLWLPWFAFYLSVPFSFYYVILFMFWYTARMRKSRAQLLERAAERKAAKDEEQDAKGAKPKTKPAPDGKAAKASAFTCTNCGADVNETDEKCPKCGAVFEE